MGSLQEKCPILKELPEAIRNIVEELLGPESCIRYCYFSNDRPSEKAIEIEPGVFYEDRRKDLGIYRTYVRTNKGWVLFEEEPC